MRAYRALRNAILTLELKPGQYLREADLVSEFDLGRTPIREAMHKLASEHLVEIRPGTGAHVAEIALSDVGDIFAMRETLVSLEVSSAISASTKQDMKELQEVIDRFDDYPTEKNYEVDFEFHSHIAAMTGNDFLRRTMEMLIAHSIRMVRVTRAIQPSVDNLIQEHSSLGKAIIDRDEDKAAEIALGHIRDSKRRILGSL